MIWIDSIEDLQYYNQPPDMPCYCDELFDPSEILLQANLGTLGSSANDVTVELYSADGLTSISDITASFEWYLFQGNNGIWYVNIQGVNFPESMCLQKCFILRVTITSRTAELPLFSKFTERYCLDSCCIVPSSISITNP